jgi:hypothetical protein
VNVDENNDDDGAGNREEAGALSIGNLTKLG